MKKLAAAFLSLLLAAGSAFAQAPSSFEPTFGQPGKDVIWVPTPQALVNQMLDMAKVTPADFVMDLGSGDGRTVITAAKRGATAVGVEYNPDMVEFSKRNAEKEGLGAKATFMQADIFQTDLSRASVITMFLLPSINVKLRPKILDLNPGTRVVSNTFTMDEWQADEIVTLTPSQGCDAGWCTALFWIVPAKVEGVHRIAQGEVHFQQRFQMLTGRLIADGRIATLEGRVRGEEITFTSGGKTYRGRMNGNTLELR